jgi:hypothetical protein
MAGAVTKSITAQNTFSDVLKVQGYFNVSITGIAGGTEVTIQRKTGVDGDTFTDVQAFTADTETYGYEPELTEYRIGVKTGDFGSGTCKVRLGSENRHRSSWSFVY